MTDKEKAKAYDEALERAKSLIDKEGLAEGSYPNRNACEAIFPELTESEDEKIRKEILDFIQLCLSRTHFGSRSIALRKEDAEMFKKWIAYLEKQKINTEGDFARGYDCGYECCLNSHGAEWSEKQKEQKSEQSEMEKEYVRTLHSLITDFLRGKQEIDREYYQKIWNWLDNRHIEQIPAEWSEDDEIIRDSIIEYINSGNIYATSRVNMITWLKSLRPQPHWKPSEEQMKALEYFVQKHKAEANAATCVWQDYENLVSLRNDLKKL